VPATVSIADGHPIAEAAVSSLVEALVTSGTVAANIAHFERPACISGYVMRARSRSTRAQGSLRRDLENRIPATCEDDIHPSGGHFELARFLRDLAGESPGHQTSSTMTSAFGPGDPRARMDRCSAHHRH
jgi:hypothetical protein